MMNTRNDNDMTNHISAIYVENDVELSQPAHWVLTMMKTIQDNYMTIRTNVVYMENEMSCSVESTLVCGEHKTRQ